MDTQYTSGFKAGQKFIVERILAYLGTKTAEHPIAASFASDIARMNRETEEVNEHQSLD